MGRDVQPHHGAVRTGPLIGRSADPVGHWDAGRIESLRSVSRCWRGRAGSCRPSDAEKLDRPKHLFQAIGIEKGVYIAVEPDLGRRNSARPSSRTAARKLRVTRKLRATLQIQGNSAGGWYPAGSGNLPADRSAPAGITVFHPRCESPCGGFCR